MAFRLLLLLRGVLLTLTLVTSRGQPEFPLTLAAGAVVVESAVVGITWRTAMSWLLSRPGLWLVDTSLSCTVLLTGGPAGPYFLFTVLSSALVGILYSGRALLFICGMQAAFFVAAVYGAGQTAQTQWIALVSSYPIAAFAGVVVRRYFDHCAEMEKGKRRAEAALAAVDERERLARDMHDSLAKTLQGISLTAAALPTWIRRDSEQAEKEAWAIVAGLRTAAHEARGLIANLRADIYRSSLGDIMHKIVSEWGRRTGIEVHLTLFGRSIGAEMPPVTKREIVSVLREALANVEAHAAAVRVWVSCTVDGTSIVLAIRDDGVGFVQAHDTGVFAAGGHYGLLGMQERARRIGGILTVDAVPAQGVTVTLIAPLSQGDGSVLGTAESTGAAW